MSPLYASDPDAPRLTLDELLDAQRAKGQDRHRAGPPRLAAPDVNAGPDAAPPPTKRQRARTPAEMRADLAKCAQLIASGRHPPHVYSRFGLTYGMVWKWLRRHDTDGSVAAMLDDARRFSAHSHADKVTSGLVRGRLAMTVPEAIQAGAISKAHQWAAEHLNPERYARGAKLQAPTQVVHHVVHFPDRGAPPDARALPEVGTVALPAGLPNRPAQREEVAGVLLDVRNQSDMPPDETR